MRSAVAGATARQHQPGQEEAVQEGPGGVEDAAGQEGQREGLDIKPFQPLAINVLLAQQQN